MALLPTQNEEIHQTTAPPDPTGSLIESEREERLREANFKADAVAQLAKQAETSAFIKKIVKVVIICIFSAALVGVGIWVAISIISNLSGSSNSATLPTKPDDPDTPVLDVIEGYRCKTATCSKAADLPDGRLLIRDTAYYIFNPTDFGAVKTTINEVSYRTIEPFMWKGLLLVTLEEATNRMGLYSITDNRTLSPEYIYTSFATDIKDPLYKGFEWVEGQYILANRPGEVRLINTKTGDEILRATNKIFCLSKFFFGYETTGERRAFTTTGTRILSSSTAFLAVTADNNYLVSIQNKTSLKMYDTTGTELRGDSDILKNFRKTLTDAKAQDYAATITANRSLFPGIIIVPN